MKRNRTNKKLTLNHETLRSLDDDRLARAQGGLMPYSVNGNCSESCGTSGSSPPRCTGC